MYKRKYKARKQKRKDTTPVIIIKMRLKQFYLDYVVIEFDGIESSFKVKS